MRKSIVEVLYRLLFTYCTNTTSLHSGPTVFAEVAYNRKENVWVGSPKIVIVTGTFGSVT